MVLSVDAKRLAYVKINVRMSLNNQKHREGIGKFMVSLSVWLPGLDLDSSG